MRYELSSVRKAKRIECPRALEVRLAGGNWTVVPDKRYLVTDVYPDDTRSETGQPHDTY